MHTRSAIIPTINIAMSIGSTRVDALPMMSLGAVGAIVHMLIIGTGARIVGCSAIAIVVGAAVGSPGGIGGA